MPTTIEKSEIIGELWRRGVLTYKLNATQLSLQKELEELKRERRVVLLAGRRLGKSFLLVLKALELALKQPGSQIKYISATKRSVQDFVLPLFEQILEDCPPSLRPRFIVSEYAWKFLNGSKISLGGTDSKHFKKLRGQMSHFTVIDEAGFMTDLENIVVSVLAPQALTTGGQTIIASSAPDTSDHDFATFVHEARRYKTCVERTIYQRIAATDAEAETQRRELAEAIRDCGGEKTAAFRREYCNDLTAIDSGRTVVPEFNTELKEKLVQEVARPVYCHKYVSMDLGFQDQTAILFGYLNFETQTLVVEDELCLLRALSKDIVDGVRNKEQLLWSGEKPLIRCADAQPLPLAELRNLGMDFLKTRNDEPESALNEVRKLLKEEKIIINPRCKDLIGCIGAAVRTSNKAKFALDRDKKYGHFDLLYALMYMVRNLRRFEDPTPLWFGFDAHKPWIKMREGGTNAVQTLKKIFSGKTF